MAEALMPTSRETAPGPARSGVLRARVAGRAIFILLHQICHSPLAVCSGTRCDCDGICHHLQCPGSWSEFQIRCRYPPRHRPAVDLRLASSGSPWAISPSPRHPVRLALQYDDDDQHIITVLHLLTFITSSRSHPDQGRLQKRITSDHACPLVSVHHRHQANAFLLHPL